nr:hypothetical protein [Clostridia bacterium]
MPQTGIDNLLKSVMPEWSVSCIIGSGSYGDVYKITRSGDMLTGSTDLSEITSESALKVIPIPRHSFDSPTTYSDFTIGVTYKPEFINKRTKGYGQLYLRPEIR